MAALRPFLAVVLLAAAACSRSAPAPADTPVDPPPPHADAAVADAPASTPASVAPDGSGGSAPARPAADGGDAAERSDVPVATSDAGEQPGEAGTAPVDAAPAGAATGPGPIPVAVFRARGVGEDGLRSALAAFAGDDGFDVRELSPNAIRRGALDDRRVVFFSGGIGSVQGGELEPEGRRIVREFVRDGGGYVGICAGSYLAIQGPPQYHHLAIVAARNWSEDAWRRGTGMLEVAPVGGGEPLRLFYANGPVFRRDDRPELPPWVALATYVDDKFCESCGTHAGELPGTPAILAASYGAGRIVLFSPNPTLAKGDAPARPELLLAAVRWTATSGPVPTDLDFADVFGER